MNDAFPQQKSDAPMTSRPRTILDWPTLQSIFDETLAVPEGARMEFLDQRCKGQPTLRLQVESLLSALESFDAAISPLDFAAEMADSAETAMPEQIGPYRVLSLLGLGGMGVVYLAERADEEFRLKVAIKLSQVPLFDEGARRRFRAERQILANLSHPNIARLLDGGATANGWPYIVMEFVDGVPITSWCARPEVTERQVLEIFCQICGAVQAAHQNLVIHRDIKPGNILVTSDGTPKLLDFGIAKLLDANASGINPAVTRAADRLLTPQYASPEQFSCQPVTTVSDVYSLGALLYELLSGKPPYDLEKLSLVEIESKVREYQPPILPGDAGRVVEKAMHKQPERRYASVSEFSRDVERLLEGKPVLARPDSLPYRLSLWTRRNRALAGSVVVLAITLVLLVISLGAGLYFTRQSELRAERRFSEVRELANALIFEVHDQIADLPGSILARKFIVEKAIQSLEGLGREAAGDTGLTLEVARGWKQVGLMQYQVGAVHIGDGKGALVSFRRALDLADSLYRLYPEDRKIRIVTADIAVTLAQNLQLIGGAKPGEISELAKHAYQMVENPQSLGSLTQKDSEAVLAVYLRYGFQLQSAGNLQQALVSLERTSKFGREWSALYPSSDELRWLLANATYRIGDVLGGGAVNLNRFPEALEKYKEADNLYAVLRRKNPASARYNAGTLFIYQRIASAFEKMGKLEQALAGTMLWRDRLSEAFERDSNNLELFRNYAMSYNNMGTLQQKMDRFADAEASLKEGLRLGEEYLRRSPQGQALSDVAVARLALGITQSRSGRPRDALVTFEAARRDFDEAIRLTPDVPMVRWRQGRVYEWIGKSNAAIASPACGPAFAKAAEQFEILRASQKISERDRDEPERLRKLAATCAVNPRR